MLYNIKEKALLFHVWEESGWLENGGYAFITDVINITTKLKPKTLILDISTEWEIPGGFYDEKLIELNNLIVKNNIEAYLLLGTVDEEYYRLCPPNQQLKNFKVKFYPFIFLTASRDLTEFGYPKPKKHKHLFFAHVNKPHYHRCLFIDHLVNEGLLEHGDFTWNITTSEVSTPYNFRYWKEKQKLAKDKFESKILNQYTQPSQQYIDSLFDLVIESTPEVTFFTEKTYKPILYGKPFLIYGAVNMNSHLEELGFKLFRDVVDYSFDSIEDDEERAIALCKELKRLSTIPLEKIEELTGIEVEFNLQLGKLLSDTRNIPEKIVKTYFKDLGLYLNYRNK